MIEIDERIFTTLCLCAFRYALERDTGISYELSNIIKKNKNNILSSAKDQIIKDIKFKMHTEGFKHVEDLENWNSLLEKL